MGKSKTGEDDIMVGGDLWVLVLAVDTSDNLRHGLVGGMEDDIDFTIKPAVASKVVISRVRNVDLLK